MSGPVFYNLAQKMVIGFIIIWLFFWWKMMVNKISCVQHSLFDALISSTPSAYCKYFINQT